MSQKCIQTTYWVYQISTHRRGLYNPELEGKGTSTWLLKNREIAWPKGISQITMWGVRHNRSARRLTYRSMKMSLSAYRH